jgi:hypothetical protein
MIGLANAVDVILHQRVVVKRIVNLELIAGARDLFILRIARVDEESVLAVLALLLAIRRLDLFAEGRVFGVKVVAELLDLLVFALLFGRLWLWLRVGGAVFGSLIFAVKVPICSGYSQLVRANWR